MDTQDDALEPDGRQLSRTFDRAMGGVGPDLAPLIAGAAERGRAIRRRRRAAVTGTVAAVTLLAVGAAVAVRPGHGPATAAQVGPDGSPAPTASAYPTPVQKPDDGPEQLQYGTGTNAGRIALTGHALVLALVESLPPGGTVSGFAATPRSSAGRAPNRPT